MPASEAASVSLTAHVATAYLGIRAAEEALELWRAVATLSSRRASSAASMVSKLLRLLQLRRKQAREITVAAVRLERALRTEHTFPELDGSSRVKDVTIGELRRDFERIVKDYAPEALRAPKKSEITKGPAPAPPTDPWKPGSVSDSERVAIEEIADLRRAFEEEERLAEQRAAESLRALAEAYHAELAELEAEAKKKDKALADEKVAGVHDTYGNVIAGEAEKAAMNGGRMASEKIAARDRRVVGYARLHNARNGSKPCAFCAVLLAQGVVYKSKKSAGGDLGGRDRYHPNCRCSGAAIYSLEEFKEDPRFAPNRFYDELYNRKFKNKYSNPKDRRIAWRNEIDLLNGAIKRPRARRSGRR